MSDMATKQVEAKAEELITDVFSAMGYELVRVQLMSGGSYLTIQVMAERTDRKPMTVEDCAQISHAVSPNLDSRCRYGRMLYAGSQFAGHRPAAGQAQGF